MLRVVAENRAAAEVADRKVHEIMDAIEKVSIFSLWTSSQLRGGYRS